MRRPHPHLQRAKRMLGRLAASTYDALASLPRFVIYNGLNAWGKGREMPHPPAETFHQWYFRNRGGRP